MENIEQQIQSNKIKLIKNTKGYSWEITLLSHDIYELERINSEMQLRFGLDKFAFDEIIQSNKDMLVKKAHEDEASAGVI